LSANVPRAEFFVETVSFVVPELVIEDGENDAVAPVGSPVIANLTMPLNPFCGVTEMLYVALAPRETVLEVGETESA